MVTLGLVYKAHSKTYIIPQTYQMGRISAHEPHEIPILDSTGTINHDISDQLAVNLGRTVKSDTLFQHVMAHIVVDCTRNCYHTGILVILDEIVCQVSRVCESVGCTD